VHVLMSTRALGPGGFGEKVRVLDSRTTGPMQVRIIRAQVEALINQHLERAQRTERVDHRSLEAQARCAALRGNPADVPAVLPRRLITTKAPAHPADTAQRRDWQFAVRPQTTIFRPDRRQVFWLKETRGAPRIRVRQPIDLSGYTGDLSINLKAHGPGAHFANAQATLAQQRMRVSRDAVRIYLDGLRATAEAAARIAETYMRVHELSVINSMHLIQHLQRNPDHAWVLENSLHLRRHFQTCMEVDAERRRAAVSAGMEHSRVENELGEHDAIEPRPWKFLSRRKWAEMRRAKRAVADDSLERYRRLSHDRSPAIEAALSWYAEAEAERRTLIPLPDDKPEEVEVAAVVEGANQPPPPSEPELELVPPALLPKPRPR
jgi:hypothetical protein